MKNRKLKRVTAALLDAAGNPTKLLLTMIKMKSLLAKPPPKRMLLESHHGSSAPKVYTRKFGMITHKKPAKVPVPVYVNKGQLAAKLAVVGVDVSKHLLYRAKGIDLQPDAYLDDMPIFLLSRLNEFSRLLRQPEVVARA